MKKLIPAAAIILCTAALAAPQKKHQKAVHHVVKRVNKHAPMHYSSSTVFTQAYPRPENVFQTVDEFVHARKEPNTPVSVEGYVVIAMNTPPLGVQLDFVDSVDHVLSTNDADAFARGGCECFIPAQVAHLHVGWRLTNSGLIKFSMYTGHGRAESVLHDVVDKARITGFTGAGRATISRVTKIELTDADGYFRPFN